MADEGRGETRKPPASQCIQRTGSIRFLFGLEGQVLLGQVLRSGLGLLERLGLAGVATGLSV